MPDEVLDNEYIRSPLDFFHFGVVSLGIVLALAGVVITSVRVVLLGLVLVAWGGAYFYTESDPIN
jgi:hypothetical protein